MVWNESNEDRYSKHSSNIIMHVFQHYKKNKKLGNFFNVAYFGKDILNIYFLDNNIM
jgi:hypothetical protein